MPRLAGGIHHTANCPSVFAADIKADRPCAREHAIHDSKTECQAARSPHCCYVVKRGRKHQNRDVN